jgi:uncharacterized protein (DUF4213/DUF364 family)
MILVIMHDCAYRYLLSISFPIFEFYIDSEMKDPASNLFKTYPFDPDKILAAACGETYVAVMLANGQIGVCSTLQKPVLADPMQLSRPDPERIDHRMLLLAFANAHVNYEVDKPGTGDIFDQVDFSRMPHTVMIGYFPPLVQKFRESRFSLSVFDLDQNHSDQDPIDRLDEDLARAGCVIMTSTTLLNQTFAESYGKIPPAAAVYLLGPSTPLSPSMKKEYGLSGLFGMQFRPYDFEVLEIISNGLGTRSFSTRAKKVSL